MEAFLPERFHIPPLMRFFMKRLSLLAVVCAILLLAGCTISPLPPEPSPTPTPSPTAAPSADPTVEPSPDLTPEPSSEATRVYVSVSSTSSQIFSDDDIQLLSVSRDNVLIKSSNSVVSDAVASVLAEYDDDFEIELANVRSQAESRFQEAVDSGTDGMWTHYGLYRYFEPVRVDENAVSVILTMSEFLGGAHPSNMLKTLNFDSNTGTLLTLRDVCSSGDHSLEEYINSRLPAIAARDPSASAFYDTYEDTLSKLVLDGIWFFDNDGITVICNEYVIAPYVAGIQYITVPYAELTSLLDPKYLPPEIDSETSGASITVIGGDPDSSYSSMRVVRSDAGEHFFLTTDKPIYNVRLTFGTTDADFTQYVPVRDIYAANRMTPDDCLAIASYIPEIIPDLMLSYVSGGQTFEFFICQSGMDGSVYLSAR